LVFVYFLITLPLCHSGFQRDLKVFNLFQDYSKNWVVPVNKSYIAKHLGDTWNLEKIKLDGKRADISFSVRQCAPM
jgi:hypothetical protein